jgi:flagellar FliL protein
VGARVGRIMAKKPKTEEPVDGEGAEDAAAKKKKLILFGGAGAAALLLIGGGAFFFLGASKPAATANGGHGAASAEAPHGDTKAPVFVDLPEMTVNLSALDGRATFLKVKVALEVADQDVVAKINPVLPRVLDAFQVYLRELRASDLDGSAGLFRVKEDLQKRINIAIYPGRVEAVLFREIVIQ